MQTLNISLYTLALLVMLALLFDFMNGFHDAANAIATVVSTGVLKPHQAVVLAAFFNFFAIAVFQLNVATTVGKGTIEERIVELHHDKRALAESILDDGDAAALPSTEDLVALIRGE